LKLCTAALHRSRLLVDSRAHRGMCERRRPAARVDQADVVVGVVVGQEGRLVQRLDIGFIEPDDVLVEPVGAVDVSDVEIDVPEPARRNPLHDAFIGNRCVAGIAAFDDR